jgi:hypothetical protein
MTNWQCRSNFPLILVKTSTDMNPTTVTLAAHASDGDNRVNKHYAKTLSWKNLKITFFKTFRRGKQKH